MECAWLGVEMLDECDIVRVNNSPATPFPASVRFHTRGITNQHPFHQLGGDFGVAATYEDRGAAPNFVQVQKGRMRTKP